MVLSRLDGSISHRRFYDLPDYLRSGDVLVFNDSRVFPARVRGRRAGTGGRVELLLLHRLERGVWQALTRPGRRMRADVAFELSGPAGSVKGRVLEVNSDGSRTVALSDDDLLMEIGDVPLPPYVHKPPRRRGTVPDGLRAGIGQRSRTDGGAPLHPRAARPRQEHGCRDRLCDAARRLGLLQAGARRQPGGAPDALGALGAGRGKRHRR